MSDLNDLGAAFWEFSVSVYGQPGVREECLRLQDGHGVDVNVLLFCAWAGSQLGIELTPGHVNAAQEAAGPWNVQIVQALRGARRALKAFDAAPRPAMPEFKAALAALELQGERFEQQLLCDWLLREGICTQLRDVDRVSCTESNVLSLLEPTQALPAASAPFLVGAATNHQRRGKS